MQVCPNCHKAKSLPTQAQPPAPEPATMKLMSFLGFFLASHHRVPALDTKQTAVPKTLPTWSWSELPLRKFVVCLPVANSSTTYTMKQTYPNLIKTKKKRECGMRGRIAQHYEVWDLQSFHAMWFPHSWSKPCICHLIYFKNCWENMKDISQMSGEVS